MVIQVPLHNPHGFFHRSGVFALEDAAITTAASSSDLGSGSGFGLGFGANPNAGPPSHPDPSDGYWKGTDPLDAADGLTVPTLVISGLNDVALDQALQQYGRLPAEHRSLLIGSWTHASALRHGIGTVFAESLAWLHGHLVGPAPPKGHVRVTVGGTAPWRDLSAWPPAAVPMSWYPHPDGALTHDPPRHGIGAARRRPRIH